MLAKVSFIPHSTNFSAIFFSFGEHLKLVMIYLFLSIRDGIQLYVE